LFCSANFARRGQLMKCQTWAVSRFYCGLFRLSDCGRRFSCSSVSLLVWNIVAVLGHRSGCEWRTCQSFQRSGLMKSLFQFSAVLNNYSFFKFNNNFLIFVVPKMRDWLFLVQFLLSDRKHHQSSLFVHSRATWPKKKRWTRVWAQLSKERHRERVSPHFDNKIRK